MLLIDGVKYKLWIPKIEDDLERLIKEHAKDIFGNDSLYLDLKQKLKSKAGIGSIPDGYVITFEEKPRWHIVEVELSSHPLYEHIVVQITKFVSGITNPYSQRVIIDAIDEEIRKDEVLKAWIKSKIGSEEIHRFLSSLISNPPIITIIIDEKTEELEEVCQSLPGGKRIVEFKTFEREGVGLAVHAHLFEPLVKFVLPAPASTPTPTPSLRPPEVYTLEQRLSYITDGKVRKGAEELLKEIQEWDKDNIVIEPIKYSISMKVSERVFSYLGPRRKHFIIETYDAENKWTGFPIQRAEDLEKVKLLLRGNYEKFKKA